MNAIQGSENKELKGKPLKRQGRKAPDIDKIMVCVTRQKTCSRLIAYGAQMAERMELGLLVAHAVRPDAAMLELADEAEALEYLSNEAYGYDGEMSVIRCDDVFAGLANCAKANRVRLLIIGSSPENATSVSERFRALLPGVSLIVLDAVGKEDQSQSDAVAL